MPKSYNSLAHLSVLSALALGACTAPSQTGETCEFECGESEAETTTPQASPATPDSAPEPNNDNSGSTPDPHSPNLILPRYTPGDSDFFRMPWPSDHRTHSDKTADLGDFPMSDQFLISRVRATIEHHVRGFSTAPVIYLQLDQAPGVASLIEPKHTLDTRAPIQLIDVSPEGCGTRTPLHLAFDAKGNKMVPPNTLAATVAEGFALRPDTPYAFVMLKTFGRQSGHDTLRPEAFDAVMRGEGDPAIGESLAPLWSCAETAKLNRDEIAVASVFTTQDPTAELAALQAFVSDPTNLPSPELVEAAVGLDNSAHTLTGSFSVPMFMTGESPYLTGGRFEFDSQRRPVVQRHEEVPFIFVRPEGEGPFPVMFWMPGTGHDEWDFLAYEHIQKLLDQGVAVFSFSPQFHGSRATPGSDPSTSTFNVVNPEAMRSVLRQQAVEVSVAVRFVRETLAGHVLLDGVDTEALVYGGHSQGALVGAMVAGVDPNFRGYMLSGGASHLSTTITYRDDEDPCINEFLQQLLDLDEPVDPFHPAVQLAQLAGDVADPHNYAHLWSGTPTRPQGANVLLIEGYHDHTTAPSGMAFFVIAGDAAPVAPAGWNIDPYELWDREPEPSPIQGNRVDSQGNPHTVAAFLDRGAGHFSLFDNPKANQLAVDFIVSATTGQPTVSYPNN